MADQQVSSIQRYWNRFNFMGSDGAMRWLATIWVRAGVVVLAVIVLAGLLWVSVWQPLMAPVQLPAGVMPDSPALSADDLQEINSARVERTGATIQPFDVQGVFGLQ